MIPALSYTTDANASIDVSALQSILAQMADEWPTIFAAVQEAEAKTAHALADKAAAEAAMRVKAQVVDALINGYKPGDAIEFEKAYEEYDEAVDVAGAKKKRVGRV